MTGRAAICRSRRRTATRAPTAPATAPTTSPTWRAPGPAVNGSNANNHQHWLSVYCGHEIQINEALQIPGSDAVKTGSMYGFANINARQARNYERQTQGVWHTMEIRMVGQQYTVLVDGNVINQFDNSQPRLASRNGDPPTPARQFPRGYFGLQTHGGTDRIFYREIRVKELGAGDIPRNIERPEVGGSGRVGRELTLRPRRVGNTPRQPTTAYTWFRSNPIGPGHVHYHAPAQEDLGSFNAPADPQFGSLPLPFRGPLKVGEGTKYTADGGRRRQARLLPGLGDQRRRDGLEDSRPRATITAADVRARGRPGDGRLRASLRRSRIWSIIAFSWCSRLWQWNT